MKKFAFVIAAAVFLTGHVWSATKISELPTGQKVGNILDETLKVGGGATTAATPTVTIPRDDATTNTDPPLLRLQKTSSGSPAAGIGASAEFEAETTSGNNEIGARISAVTTDVTSTSEDFDLRLSTMVAGSTTLVEGARLRGERFSGGTMNSESGYFALFESTAGALANTTSDRRILISNNAGYINVVSGGQYAFSSVSGAADVGTAGDTGFGRHSAGVGKLTNGSTTVRALFGGGSAVASASALPVPTGAVFHVTGTTNIDSITATNLGAGVCFTMIFDGVLTVADGSNLKLSAAFATTADDTLSMCYDGANFFETARSVN